MVHLADRVEHRVVAVYQRRLTVTLAERNYFVIAVKGNGAHLLMNLRDHQDAGSWRSDMWREI